MERHGIELADGRACCVRRAEEGDLGRIAALIGDMERHGFAPEPLYARWSEQLDCGRYTCLVACVDHEVAGLINLRCEWQLHHERPVAEIMELVVDPGERGRGVGGVLFGAASRLARKLGCELIEVHSKNERTAAHRFYERQGMVKTHVHLTLPLDGS